MKTMTCRQLGGACDKEFRANTFDEMAGLSKRHGTEMFQAGDESHLQAMKEMQVMMQDPAAMQQWFAEKQQLFESLPEE